jgi:DNA-binding LacI/PurR family transcriptional regulator/DNA-binding transcriptional regulator YhcF (GntR family)
MGTIKAAAIRKLLAFQPTGQRPATKEIAAHLRTLIKSGVLASGTGIPSTKDMAAAWGVFPNTVKLALDPLVKEGLLDRRQNRGTFVLDGHRKIQRLGIYENFGDISASDRDFMVSLQIELSWILEKQNAELKVWIDNRRAPKSLPENMVEACRKREIDGVLCIQPRRKIIKSLRNLPVPVAALTWIRECPGQVNFRYDELVEMSLRRLADRGSKRVGVIANMGRNDHFNRPNVSNFYEFVTNTASALGLETRPEWVINPPLRKETLEIERFGYESMKNLWSRGTRPDGLFIFPHTAVRGSLTALLELGVNIPEDLKLVAHGNIETPILTPYPVDWITSSSHEIDQAMVNQIQDALDGLPTKTIWLKHRPAWQEEG